MSLFSAMIFHTNSLHFFQEDNLDEIFDGIQSTNQNKTPKSFIGDYAVLELLGSGGFGSVYKVKKKKSGQSFLAMKEVGIMWLYSFPMCWNIIDFTIKHSNDRIMTV